MLYVIALFIIWNWGLTPLWVNVVVTILCASAILIKVVDFSGDDR